MEKIPQPLSNEEKLKKLNELGADMEKKFKENSEKNMNILNKSAEVLNKSRNMEINKKESEK